MKENRKIWINTRVELEWDGEKYIETHAEGFWYDGPLALAKNNSGYDQDSYRWRDDDGSESGATNLSTNASYDFDASTGNVDARLRILLQEINNASANNMGGFVLMFQINGGGYTQLGAATTGCIYYDSASITDDGDTTQQLGSGTPVSTPNYGICEDGASSGLVDFAGNDELELEFTIRFVAADLSDGDSIDFQVWFDSTNDLTTAGSPTAGGYTRTANATITKGATNITETIPNGSLTLTGIAPLESITGHVRESIPNGALSLTGFAPNDYVAGNTVEPVPAGSLTLTGFAPTTKTPGPTELIPNSFLTLTSFAPLDSITGHVRESIPSSNLTLLSNAPLDYQTGHVRESVPNHTLTLSSFAPLAYQPTENTTELIPSSNLVLTSFAPLAAVATTNVTETIPAGSLTLVGFAPSDYQTGHVRESIPVAGLFLNGFAPTAQVPTDNTVEPVPNSNLVLLSTAPAVSVVGNVTEQIPNNVIQLSAYVPTIRNTGAVVTVTERPTGGISKRVKQRKPRQIMVDGKMYTIENPHQELFILQAFLDKLERQFTLDIQKKKVPAVKRKIKLGQSNIARVKTRIKKVETRIEWLRKQDQEILALLAA